MNLITIEDINAPEIDVFAGATENQLRRYGGEKEGVFLAESANVILRALGTAMSLYPCSLRPNV